MVLHSQYPLKNALKQGGFRFTYQREAILHLFQKLPAGTQLSAKALHALLEDGREYISLSSIYRTLDVLVQVGFLRSLKTQPGCTTYELNVAPSRNYLVCDHCQYTLELTDEAVLEIGQKQTKRMGFHLMDHQIILHVLCSEAWSRRAEGEIPRNWKCRHAN